MRNKKEIWIEKSEFFRSFENDSFDEAERGEGKNCIRLLTKSLEIWYSNGLFGKQIESINFMKYSMIVNHPWEENKWAVAICSFLNAIRSLRISESLFLQ